MRFPELKEVEAVGRSRECSSSSMVMTLLVAHSNSTISTKTQVLSLLQYLGEMRGCNALLLVRKGELVTSRFAHMPEEETSATCCFDLERFLKLRDRKSVV